jgi:membrane associated rhomboid family serine protease
MLLITPLSLDMAQETPPQRPTPVVWWWCAVVTLGFAIDRALVVDHDLALGLVPDGWFAVVTYLLASGRFYGDPLLFDPWQVWSYVLVHPVWWHLVVEVVLMLVVGRALERLLGSWLFLAALGCLAPVAGLAVLVLGAAPAVAGGLPLVAGLLGLALGRVPKAEAVVGLWWWAVVVVGTWPWFRLPLHTLVILFLVLVLATAPSASAAGTLAATVLATGLGLVLGLSIRRRAPATA